MSTDDNTREGDGASYTGESAETAQGTFTPEEPDDVKGSYTDEHTEERDGEYTDKDEDADALPDGGPAPLS
ncbi:hypothetical protein [Glaciihabitans sp. UYNi722]|uniref:hypothetical protein n=1 Tax=Glaciihabitans sp. UYNi722 TaxID=3156344 RepID=UPI00339B9120